MSRHCYTLYMSSAMSRGCRDTLLMKSTLTLNLDCHDIMLIVATLSSELMSSMFFVTISS